MRVVVVVSHPNDDSLTRACADAAGRGLRAGGHVVDEIDLYRIGFQPAMTSAEREAYHGATPVLDPLVARSVASVQDADALVFVYPTWWSGLPAMLKGWLEKTMVPGVAFRFDDKGKVRPALTSVQHIVGISTYGSNRGYVRFVNDNGRRILVRALRLNTGWRTRTTWLGLYSVDTATAGRRQEFLDRIERQLATL